VIYYHNLIASLDYRAAEDSHIDIGQSIQAAFERFKILLGEAQLIHRTHPPDRFSGGPEASRRSLDYL